MPLTEHRLDRHRTRRVADWRASMTSTGLLLLLWEVAGRAIDSALLPSFSSVLAALVTLTAEGRIVGNLGLSLVSLAAGFALAVVVGVTLGALMGRYRLLGEVLDPYLWIGVSAPGLLYVPILFALFGTSRLTQVAAVFTHAVWIVIAMTETGVRRTSPALEHMATAFGASERDLFWKVRLPEARPHIAAGLRIGVLYAVKGMINGEMFLALVGLGALVRTYGGRFEAANVLAVVLVIVSVALGAAAAVGALTRRYEAAP